MIILDKYICIKTDDSVEVNGDINKKVWKQAAAVELVDNVTGLPPKQGTTVKLLWDDEYLYAAFRCIDDEINAAMTKYNDLIYTEEVVEIFIDDNRDLKTYLEVEISPLNTLLHYSVHNDLSGRIVTFARTERVIRSAVIRDEGRKIWDVEIAIPFSEIMLESNAPPKPNDKWRFNVYRIDRKAGGDEFTAWQPTGTRSFHRPEKFGELVFFSEADRSGS